ncbi:glycogen/starch/alpha-glucan phosphorylase [Simkania negevensis]|uniref:Alpha-1,4 glucan phosphorylase n=1 Tax=Simkania negevensis TaxID=83561 RepID=A0ABS3AQD9_9BACT|nr:glycogen/starch/alpha-glucan phosphorylase [Simkania negevensis]
MGRVINEASDKEYYQAFCFALREEIMINWLATMQTFAKQNTRMLYYLSMEYLPGRFTGNNITNIGATDIVRKVMRHMGRDFDRVLSSEPDPGLGNGGLGRLASCFLDSLATQQYPAVGYGLRYQYGIFEQELWDGIQLERPDPWLLDEYPWEFRRDQRSYNVKFCGRPIRTANTHSDEVYDIEDCEEVRALAYDIPIIGYDCTPDFSVLTMRLWTTKESPRNFGLQRYNAGHLDQAAENIILTDVLYPNDNHETGKRIRLKQEFLLVSASLQDIMRRHLIQNPDMSNFKEKIRIQSNDTHPALVVVELMRILTKDYDFSWNQAWETTQACTSYTNHTILAEALEEWNVHRLSYILPRQYNIIERINLKFCNKIRKQYPNDEDRVRRMTIINDGQIKMANLSIVATHCINGVSALHTELLQKTTFKDFAEMYPTKFTNVTNGVTPRRWLLHCNPRLSQFISERIGDQWITNFDQIDQLQKFASDPDSQREFLKIKRQNKEALRRYLLENYQEHDFKGKLIKVKIDLHLDALFDCHIKRIHEYKRQLLSALHLIMLYFEIVDNPQETTRIQRTFIYAGKAAPGYHIAKNIIRLINCIARTINNDPDVKEKLQVVFIPNYNVSKAEFIMPAAELSEQISTAGLEASGTGNMKFSMNGALTIGTDDGANVEMRKTVGDQWWPFLFGASVQEIEQMQTNQSYNAWDIYSKYPHIRRAVDSLRDRTFSKYDAEHQALTELYHSLLESSPGRLPDPYFILQDLIDYYETQKKVEELYKIPEKWAEYAIHNIAGMGQFSSDNSIHKYAREIWDITPCAVNKELLEHIRSEFRAHDQCRIIGHH